ncbi:MAG: CbtA family protein [Alphaproteobacteria bacterium]|nr:CbtA family protein [Alphaproteobacteria bacterium]
MIKRVFLAALAAGALAAVFITAVQAFTTTPIILHAEEYEKGQASSGRSAVPVILTVFAMPPAASQSSRNGEVLTVQGGATSKKVWSPGDGIERTLYTGLANLLAAVGFALLIVACFVIHDKPIDARRGVMWGIAGFAIFILAPSLGLPPEAPGAKAAGLIDRQVWWAFATAMAALGLWLMVFTRHGALKVLGVIAIAVPHLVGAPQPAELGGSVPPEIAGHFAAASIVVNAIFWTSLGWLAGTFYERLSR